MREIRIHDEVEDYLNQVIKGSKADFTKLHARIQKLAEHGMSIVDGRTYKKIKNRADQKSIIQIKIITKQYRIHTFLTPSFLYLIHAFDKKQNKTAKKDLNITFKRAKTISHY